ncbi:hypothetical protein HJC23_006187 [Cyclotella cryptica]|uniref:SPRY domain-containing protein n=1 Tax=Cyclotella cryptica TaxID=29204 RepID=A0ABD3Q0K6_9STRA
MGGCCSCLTRFLSSSGIEMSENSRTEDLVAGESMPQVHSIDIGMSAPTIQTSIDSSAEVQGHGLALLDVTVEQDRAYWEWRVRMNGDATSSWPPMFGVSNKRNAKFYEILAESAVPPEKHGTKFMCAAPNLKDGDVVGVVVRQSEIPMIQLYLNGEAQDGLVVSRFRGTVYPSIFLPECSEGSISASFLYREEQFVHGSPR